MTNVYLLFAVAAGAGVAAQAIINARLRFVLGAPVIPISLTRVLGAVLLAVGVILIRW